MSRPSAPGRPRIPLELIELIRRVSRDNPTWGAPRIHGEVRMPGFEVSEATVARYMIKRRGRPTQDWKTFLTNHLGETVTGSTGSRSCRPSRAWESSSW